MVDCFNEMLAFPHIGILAFTFKFDFTVKNPVVGMLGVE